MKKLSEIANGVEVTVVNIDDLIRYAAGQGQKEVQLTKEEKEVFNLFMEENGFSGDVFAGVKVHGI